LLILLRITDSPIHAVECRHDYCREWIGKERLAIILFLILSAKGERRVNRDRLIESEMMENKGIDAGKLQERLCRQLSSAENPVKADLTGGGVDM
jgi:hypothetical protein